MSSTLTLQNAINFSTPFLKNQPLQVSIQEPALMGGNIVLGAMLGPPLKWRNNRQEISFPITAAASDYSQYVPTLGFIESAWLVNGNGDQYPLNPALALTINGDQGRPERIAPQFDDNNGNITFRMDKKPDAAYACYVDFQKKMQLMTSAASTFAPVSDEFCFIFYYGYLAIMSLLVNDARFPIFEKYFIGRLLGAQSGLTEQERNIFLANWATSIMTMKRADMAANGSIAQS